MGFLVLLERLTPIERAVFVLHDALDHPYELVAEAVGRSEDACRQALSRARKHVDRAGPSDAGRAPAGRGGRRRASSPSGWAATSTPCSPRWRPTSWSRATAAASPAPRSVPVVGADRVARFLRNLGSALRRRPARRAVRDQRQPGPRRAHADDGWSALSIETDGDVVTASTSSPTPPSSSRLVAVAGTGRGGPPGRVGGGAAVPPPARRRRSAERRREVDTRCPLLSAA